MGQHSSTERWPFYRSVLGWVVPATVIGLVVVSALRLTAGGGPAGNSGLGAQARQDISPSGSAQRDGSETPDRPGTEVSDGARGSGGARSGDAPGEDPGEATPGRGGDKPLLEVENLPLVTEGVTVQVLNSTPSAQAAADMARQLGELGFDVISVESAASDYPKTTVFWSFSEAQRPALRLAGRFGWRAAPKPANLSPQVAVHVVVGADEA